MYHSTVPKIGQNRFVFLIVFLLIISLMMAPIKGIVPSVPKEKSNDHSVLVEVASSQGCSGCHTWNSMVYDEYLNGDIDFHFVEMIVYDHSWEILNNKSYDWKELFGISSYPTTIFDGGFEQQIGSNYELLQENLLNCDNRDVFDLDADINVTWSDQAQLNISINITNNEQSTYEGRIRSHITEIVSRYTTNNDDFYHFGFLDFAFDKNITIPVSESYVDYVIWIGRDHEDAHGDSFDDLEINNTMVFLGVFDDKGFCDESVATIPFNITGNLDTDQSVHDRGFPIRHALDGDWGAAQSVKPMVGILTKTEIYLRRFGTPEFNLTVELRENHPQGTLLDTVVFTPEEIQPNWYWVSLNFDDITVTPDTEYYIVCPPAPLGVSTSFGYEWGYAFGNQYDDGSFWFTRDGGGLWRDLPTMYEFTFRTYGYS